MTDPGSLLESIRNSERRSLSADDVRELLAWLAGLSEGVTQPDHDPVLLQLVLFRLDTVLFRDGALDLNAAGVGREVPAAERRGRFRRLASAFHPDRFPAQADWLTVRSQAVHIAYAAFKKNPDDVEAPAASPAYSSAAHARYANRESTRESTRTSNREAGRESNRGSNGDSTRGARAKRRPGTVRRILLDLRRRFGHDRNLGTKLVAGLALLALLPVINLLLAPSAHDVERASADPGTAPGRIAAARPDASAGPASTAPGPQQAAGAAEGGPLEPPAGNDDLTDIVSVETAKLDRDSGSESEPQFGSRGDPQGDPQGDPRAAPDVDSPVLESPLTLAARRALGAPDDRQIDAGDEGGHTQDAAAAGAGPSDPLPTDHRLADLGLASDAERLYALLDSSPNRSDEPPSRTRRSTPVRAESDTGADPNGDPNGDPDGETLPAVQIAQTSDAPNEPAIDSNSGVGPTPEPVASTQPNTSAEPGLINDVERSPVGSRTAMAGALPAREPESARRSEPTAPAAPAVRPAAERPDSALELASADTDPTLSNKKAGRSPPQPANDSALERAAASRSSAAEAPATTAGAALEPEPTVELPPSERVLGPLRIHPAGRVLTQLADAVESGDAATVQRMFAPGADAGSSRYQVMASDDRPRSVQLRILRMERDSSAWRVQIELDVFVAADGRVDSNRTPLATFWLANHDDMLKIVRTEP